MDNIEAVFYINLESRQDRKQNIESELNILGIKYERFNAIPTPGFGILGCGLSHLAVIELAKQRGYQNVLILEDDTHFVLNREEINQVLNRFFSQNIEYNVLFLSYVIYQGEKTEYSFLTRGLHTTTATAYIVNSNYYDQLIELYRFSTKRLEQTREHWNYANDLVWKDLQSKDKWYCIHPIIAIQQSGYSDNSMSYQDYTNNYIKYYK